MSNREKCISIIDLFSEEQLVKAALILEEIADDVFCAQMHENYLENPDKGEAVLFEDFAREIYV